MRISRKRVRQIVEDAQSRLGLQDWKIDIHIKKLEDQYGLCWNVRPSEKRAEITVDTSSHQTIEQLTNTLVHETVHIAHFGIDDLFSDVLKKLHPKNKEARDEAWDHYDRVREELVVRITKALET